MTLSNPILRGAFLVLVGLATIFALDGAPQDALAHAVLLESTPRARDAVSEARRLDLRFNSRLEPAFSQLRLTWPSGEHVPLQVGFSRAAPNRLTASLPASTRACIPCTGGS